MIVQEKYIYNANLNYSQLLPDATIGTHDQPINRKVRGFYRIAEPALKTNQKSIMERIADLHEKHPIYTSPIEGIHLRIALISTV